MYPVEMSNARTVTNSSLSMLSPRCQELLDIYRSSLKPVNIIVHLEDVKSVKGDNAPQGASVARACVMPHYAFEQDHSGTQGETKHIGTIQQLPVTSGT